MIKILENYQQERIKRQDAEWARDKAVKEKSWIGTHREATAMNTAAQFSKENQRLKSQIGDSRTWKQVKAIPWLKEFFNLSPGAYSQIGRQLSKLSRNLGHEVRDIPHSKYGKVKIYHSEIIEHFRHKLLDDLNLLKRYRKI